MMTYYRDEHFTKHPLSNPKKMREFLSQTRYWVDAQFSKVRIRDMDSDYLLSTMIHLLNRSVAVRFIYETYYELKGANTEKLEELRALTAEQFIRDTPLFRAMHHRYIKLHQDDELVIPSVLAVEDDDEDYDDGSPY